MAQEATSVGVEVASSSSPRGASPPWWQGQGATATCVRGEWGGGGDFCTFVGRGAGDPTVWHSRWGHVAWLSTLMTVLIHLTFIFQNLCLSLLALVTYLRREIMEDHGIHRNTMDLFWNLQDFEVGRVRMVKLMLLVVRKCFICPNWAFLFICWWFLCLRFKCLFRDPEDRRSNQRYFASNLGTLPATFN